MCRVGEGGCKDVSVSFVFQLGQQLKKNSLYIYLMAD